MIEGLTGRIGCAFGRHVRSKGRARLVEGHYVSRCRSCGIPMRQRGNKDWIVDRGRTGLESAADRNPGASPLSRLARPLLLCILAGLVAGALLAIPSARDARNAVPHRIAPSGIDPDGEEVARDPLGDSAGYSLAVASGSNSFASCDSLQPPFRAGCRDYVRERHGRIVPGGRPKVRQ